MKAKVIFSGIDSIFVDENIQRGGQEYEKDFQYRHVMVAD